MTLLGRKAWGNGVSWVIHTSTTQFVCPDKFSDFISTTRCEIVVQQRQIFHISHHVNRPLHTDE